MDRYTKFRISTRIAALSAALLTGIGANAATKTVDLDAQAANGAESQCDLNVLQTFPVKIENKVTNKALGDAFSFSWKSAGPGGFTSSVPAGSTGGVGAIWTWTTNQTVYAYTGNSCANDVCFTQTGGPDSLGKKCSLACLEDGIVVTVGKGAGAGEVDLNWPATTGPYTVYRAVSPAGIVDPANVLVTTDLLQYTDFPQAGTTMYYRVRGPGCITPKPCATDADCSPSTEGTCVSRGPFTVPGRSLFTNDVTVSSASLTSSLITFFSPPKEVFRVTSSVAPGGSGVAYEQSLTNTSTQPLTVTVNGYPPGCCEEPHQINCDGKCYSYLTDPDNCGGCGIACGEGYFCSEGACLLICPEGTSDCDATCVDLQNDPGNCGVCGQVCVNTPCQGSDCVQNYVCTGGACVACDAPRSHACDNKCVDINSDTDNCGSCGVSCDAACENGSGLNYCSEGACVCVPGPGLASTGAAFEGGVIEAPICETPPSVTVIPPGATSTDCLVSGVLAKEVPTTVVICGDGIPSGEARCANGDPASQGTFMKLVPDPTKPIGAAYVTPFAVHVTDPSNDGLIEPGETVTLRFDVLNAGPTTIFNAKATMISPAVDLSDDGVANPIGVTISTTPVSFGNILGSPATSGDCTHKPSLNPAASAAPFQVTVPSNHPGDTSRPFILKFTGTVGDSPFAMDMPIGLGIADKCVFAAATRDFDGLTGLLSPMAKLVPLSDQVPFPSNSFEAGDTRPLKLRQSCGGVNLTASDADAPQIVGLSEQARGPLDITTLNLNGSDDDLSVNPNDPFFRYDTSASQWFYNMRTSQIGTGTFTLTIRIAGRKDYVTGFVLRND